MCHNTIMIVSKYYHDCVKILSWLCHNNIMNVSKCFHGCANYRLDCAKIPSWLCQTIVMIVPKYCHNVPNSCHDCAKLPSKYTLILLLFDNKLLMPQLYSNSSPIWPWLCCILYWANNTTKFSTNPIQKMCNNFA